MRLPNEDQLLRLYERSGRNNTAFTTVKIAVFAPMPAPGVTDRDKG